MNELLKSVLTLFTVIFFTACERVEIKSKNEVLEFLERKDFRFSLYKRDIPDEVLKFYARINGGPFEFGDTNEVERINLSDLVLLNPDGSNPDLFNRRLYFILFNDSVCLLSYKQGGIGTHAVIDFVKYRGTFNHIRYVTFQEICDTVELGVFLRKDSALINRSDFLPPTRSLKSNLKPLPRKEG